MDIGGDKDEEEKNQDQEVRTNIGEGPSEGKKLEEFCVVSFPFSPSFHS